VTLAVHVDQQRDESMLGASEAAGVLGCDKYNPPIKIWRRHRGLIVADDADQSEPAYWGTVLEPVVRGHYAVRSDRLVVVPTSSSSRDGWLRCTPDGISIPVPRGMSAMVVGDGDDDFAHIQQRIEAARRFGAAGGLQVKTCSAWLADDWREGAPPKYEIQCRVEMAVTGLPWTDLVCLCGGQQYLGPLRIERDLDIEDRILVSLHEFWDMVQSGREPTVDHTDAWRLHVSEKMERARPATIKADHAIAAAVQALRARRRARISAERAEELGKNDLLLSLSAAGATRVDAGELGRITAYRTSSGTWAIKTPTSWKDDE
jgi:predicted phage-related endonuclease